MKLLRYTSAHKLVRYVLSANRTKIFVDFTSVISYFCIPGGEEHFDRIRGESALAAMPSTIFTL